jgi:DeoR family suf operon transcriptional repressor
VTGSVRLLCYPRGKRKSRKTWTIFGFRASIGKEHMQADRFFQTTRGRIVEELRRRKSASAVDLADTFGLSPNAVRQQLVVLERDGLVVERSVRRGPTKPTYEFSLTAEAEKLFPQHYDKMLGAVLREIKEQFGQDGVSRVFDGIAKRTVAKAKERVTAPDTEGKVAQLAQVLREGGVVAEYSLIDGGFALHEHNCPYSEVAKEHPEVCSVIHHVLDETVGSGHVQTESLATGGNECRFEVKSGRDTQATTGKHVSC